MAKKYIFEGGSQSIYSGGSSIPEDPFTGGSSRGGGVSVPDLNHMWRGLKKYLKVSVVLVIIGIALLIIFANFLSAIFGNLFTMFVITIMIIFVGMMFLLTETILKYSNNPR